MGNGNILNCVYELLGADVYGVDIDDYLFRSNYLKNRTFTNTNVCDLPQELSGTFDVAYQRFMSIPFKDTLKVFCKIAELLKPNGIYFVTFCDDWYMNEDSFVPKILKEMYDRVEVIKHHNIIYGCVATTKYNNPSLTPMDSYYNYFNTEEFEKFKQLGYKQQKQLLKSRKFDK